MLRKLYTTPLWLLQILFFLVFAFLVIYAVPQIQPYIYLRCLSTFIIVFLLPGFALIKMLFPKEGVLSHIEEAALSIGVSLTLNPLVTLILNYTVYGVNQSTLLSSLTLLIIMFTAGAILRWRRLKADNYGYIDNQVNETGFSLISTLHLMLPLALAICLRVTPFLLSGLPFSVDAWPSIKYAEILLEKSPISLNAEELKGCDELGDRLFGAAVSALAGLQPIAAMAFYVPIAGAITILTFYALVRIIYGWKTAFVASMLLATAIPDTILTAGVKGETYAHPLYMLLILLFLHKGIGFWKKVLLFSLTSISLALTHYYTAILIAATLTSMGMASLISKWIAGEDLDVYNLAFPLILAVAVLAYLTIYANWAFKFIASIDWLSAASYQLTFSSLATYLALKPHNTSRAKTVFLSVSSPLVAFTLAFLATKKPIVPSAPILPVHYLLYAGPFIVASPLMVLGYGRSKSLGDERAILSLFWLAVVLGLEGYAVFGNTEAGLGLTLAYRGLVFLLPPLIILCAVGLASLLEGEAARLRITKTSAAVILSAILALNLYAFYATIFIQERYMGYFWLYRISEYRAGLWLSNVCGDGIIAGDVKFTYLLRYYFRLKIDEFQSLLFLSGKSSSKPSILITYDQMAVNGYVLYGGYSVDLPEGWTGKLHDFNAIYSNGFVEIYGG